MSIRASGWWWGFEILALAWAVLGLAVQAQFVVAAEEGAVPADQAVLEVPAPSGAAVSLDDKDQGEKREFTFAGLRPGQYATPELRVRFKDGEVIERRVLLRGGWRVRLPLHSQAGLAGRPELVVQTGHTYDIRSVAISPDGRYILTGSSDTTAALWEAGTGRKIRTFQGHTRSVKAVAFSPDGKLVLTGAEDETAALWDAGSGRQIRTFKGHAYSVDAVAFSPDGKHVLTGSFDRRANLWEAGSGKKVRIFEGHANPVEAVAFSPDGKQVLTGSSDNTAVLWETASGRKSRTFEGHIGSVSAVAFSPDGKHVLTGSTDHTAVLWEADSGRKVRTFQGHTDFVRAVAFSPDGKHVLTGSDDKTAALWDADSGRRIRSLNGHTGLVRAVAFSPDGKQVLTGSDDHTAALWEVAGGRKIRSFEGHTDFVSALAVSPDGKQVATSFGDTAVLWDTGSGRQVRTFRGHTGGVFALAFSPDGKHVLTGSHDQTAMLWETDSGRKVRTFEGHTGGVWKVAFSPDGKHVLTGSQDKTAALWEAASGRKVHSFKGHYEGVDAVAVGPDGKYILTGSVFDAVLWEADSGRKVRTFPGRAVLFSPDGKHVLTEKEVLLGSREKAATLWEIGSGQEVRTFQGRAVAFSPDGKHVLTGSGRTSTLWETDSGRKVHTFQDLMAAAAFSPEGRRLLTHSGETVALWDLATGDELARLLSLDGGKDWLVVSPEGFFDGSPQGRQKVAYRVGGGLTVVPVDRFFQDFYRPGLFAESFRGQRPLPGVDFARQRPPSVRIVSPKAGAVEMPQVALEAEASDEGGGVSGPFLYHNGARVLASGTAEKEGKVVKRRFAVTLVQGDNRLEVRAASADGSWESEPALLSLRYDKPLDKPDLHLVAVGVSRYAQGSFRLKFARADAEAIVKLFQDRGPALYRKVHVTPLLDEQATGANVRKALREVAEQARAQDTLLLFVAGHGAMVGQRYYFLPHDFTTRPGAGLDDEVREQGIAADVLGDFLSAGPALRRLLILDTCASGGAVGLFQVASRNPFAFRGAVERLGRSQGVYVLAVAAATEEAKEPEALGHGVLSYALLAGLKAVRKGPLEDKGIQPSGSGGVVDVLEWFAFAAGHVPRLTKEFCGQEQNVHTAGRGGSFPVLPLEKP
jgi:WD40 repeat protein